MFCHTNNKANFMKFLSPKRRKLQSYGTRKQAWHACSLIIKQSQQSFGLLLSGCYHINGFNVRLQTIAIYTLNDMLHDIILVQNSK